MALPPIKGQGIGSLIVPQEQLDANYCWATNRPRTGSVVARELMAPQGGENPDVNALESYTPINRGSREKPMIMRYPYDIGNAKNEMPHVMQFKIFWRWENPEFAQAAENLKKESEENLEQLASSTSLIEDGNFNYETFMQQFGTTDIGTDQTAMKMLFDPNFVDPQNPSNNRNLYELLNNPETREEGRRIMEKNVRSATDRVENISSEFAKDSLGNTSFGATNYDDTVLSNRFNRLLDQTAASTGAKSLSGIKIPFTDVNLGDVLQQRDPQYDQMVSIYLPICTRINNEETFSYTDTDMKIASGIVAGIGALASGYQSGRLGEALVETGKQAAAAAATALLRDGPFGGALTSVTGLVLNPRIEKIFQQKDIRNFSFSWDLYPRNEEEVKNIKNIIETFRYHSHPSRSRGGDSGLDAQIMLRVPAEFTIKFLSSSVGSEGSAFVENEYIPKISRCVLNSISVDYTPNGVFSTLKDNSPSGYTLTLSFSEVAQLTREDVEAGF